MSSTTNAPSKGSFFSGLSKVAGGASMKQFGILGALILIILVFEIWTGGKTLAPGNVINIVRQNAHILVLAIGMVMVIIAGHIDLSVGSVAAFSGLVVAMAVNQSSGLGLPWWVGIIIGILVGALIGAWQGFWVAYVGVPAFIVTLAGMLMWRGAKQLLGQ